MQCQRVRLKVLCEGAVARGIKSGDVSLRAMQMLAA